MTTISTVEAREHFSEIINRSVYAKERILLTRRGKQIAAIIPLEDLKLLEMLEDQLDLKGALLALKEANEKGGGIFR